MNRRIRKKILKRCRAKFESDTRRRHRNMPYEEVISILTGLEKRVWMVDAARLCRITDRIIAELKAEGKW